MVKVVALTGTLTHTREHGVTGVQLGDVVDELHDDHGFAHAGTTKRADLAALEERADEVDDLDAGGQQLGGGGLLGQRRSLAVNRVVLVGFHRAALVHRGAGHVEHAAHHAGAHRHGDGCTGVDDIHAALESLGGGHGHGADPVVAQVQLHLEGELDLFPVDLEVNREGVVDGRQGLGELCVNNRADDLYNLTFVHS